MSATRQVCTFALGDRRFAVDVGRVLEVLRGQEITRLPLAPPGVLGLVNLRGRIVTAVDLRRCLGLDERPPGAPLVHLVVEDGMDPVSLIVDSIGDVIEVSPDRFEPPPATLTGRDREMVRGAWKLEDGLLHLLDVEHALARTAKE